jgi:OmpA-OmpF porin, OOP family
VLVGLSGSLIYLEVSKKKNLSLKDTIDSRGKEVLSTNILDPFNDTKKNNPDLSTNLTIQTDSKNLIEAVTRSLAKNDLETTQTLIQPKILTPDILARLKKISTANTLNHFSVREVGEIELNQRIRYSIKLAENENDDSQIYFDLKKDGETWSVEQIILPSNTETTFANIDPLTITNSFIQATLRQDLVTAKKFIDEKNVSDATIAGLCILFEEGHYHLRKEKSLRSVISKENIASFLVNVENNTDSKTGQFAIALKKDDSKGWLINDLNLDSLLSDFSSRVAGGDIYYTPLIKNPQGGSTLVLYFEFDTDDISPRMQRQLDIVSTILKTDSNKKINLTGHADIKGSQDYNQSLSARRAEIVKKNLIEKNVSQDQIITAAKGFSQPRRPNYDESGKDNPDGRKANRRTELYLDF